MAEILDCCSISQRELMCLIAQYVQGGAPGGIAEITTEENTSVPEGFASVAILKNNATGTVDVTFDVGTFVMDTNNMSIKLDLPGKLLPAIAIASDDGGTWAWIGIV